MINREAEGGSKNRAPLQRPGIIRGDDRQRLVPEAIVAVLTVLLAELDDAPSYIRVELASIRTRLCRVFRVEDPMDRANASQVAQDLAEEDGIPIEE